MKKKISIQDVARRANVSISTVSRVMNNTTKVSVANRSRVESAVADLHFKPNSAAQNLARGGSTAIGLVMPGYPGVFHSFYAIEIIRGVGHACEILKLDMIFHITNGLNSLNTTNVGGVIFADIIENHNQIEAAVDSGTPCMVVNNQVDDLNVNYIAVDNVLGGEIAADYFADLGHKKIATVTGSLTTQAGAQRLEGFKTALRKKGVSLPKEYIYQGDYSRRCARFATEQFLNLESPPTAIFAASDDMALEVIAVIMENGLKVPGDISVIGFDDNPSCLSGSIAVTTIRQPLFRMGEEAVRTLHSIMLGKEHSQKRKIFSPELVIRESCAVPKRFA